MWAWRKHVRDQYGIGIGRYGSRPKGARIATLVGSGPMARRLGDLGFVQGTGITCLYRSPAGDPTAYGIRGTVIALRKQDAARVRVRL